MRKTLTTICSALSALALTASLAPGQAAAAPQGGSPAETTQINLQIAQVDNQNFPNMTMYVKVTNPAGQVLEGLAPANFTVVEYNSAGQAFNAVVTSVKRMTTVDKLSMDLVLDQSGSMYGSPLADAKSAATTFVNEIQQQAANVVEITSFDDSVYIKQPFTTSAAAAKTAIKAITANGSTAIYDAIVSALRQTSTQPGARCVVLFTDGYENASSSSVSDVVKLAATTNIPVYIIGVGNDVDEADLQYLASVTGGAYYSAAITGLETALNQIYNNIYNWQRDLYQINFKSQLTSETNISRQVNVTAASGDGSATASRKYLPTKDYTCWNGKTKTKLKSCSTPNKLSAIKYMYPSITLHSQQTSCVKKPGSSRWNNAKYYECVFSDKSTIRYRYWPSAKDSKKHYKEKYGKAKYTLYLNGQKAGVVYQSKKKDKATGLYQSTLVLTGNHWSLSVDAKTLTRQKEVWQTIRIRDPKAWKGYKKGTTPAEGVPTYKKK
ncbi:MAG: VWA domain-containing protein [Propionibacteriaceae bacterium]|jgi:VWFA-related protein|nr:VWA domain-containing protein [Propionibacteriaceae bacterium]